MTHRTRTSAFPLARNGRLLALALLLAQCGTEVGNPKKPNGGTTPPPSQYAGDTQAATALVGAQLDDASGAIADEGDASAAALLLAGAKGEFTRTCTTLEDGAARVTRVAEGSFSTTKRRGKAFIKTTREGKDATTLTWRKKDKALACNAAGTAVRLSWGDGEEITLVSQVDRARTVRFQRAVTGQLIAETRNEAKGERAVTWKAATAATADKFSREKAYSQDMTRTITLTGANGREVSLTAKVTVPAAAPVVLSSEYDAATNDWSRHVLRSGRMVSELANDSRVEVDFSDVAYDAAGGCRPVSGTMKGATFAAGADTPTLTFTVDFAQGLDEDDSPVHVTFANGETKTFVPDSCLLDADAAP